MGVATLKTLAKVSVTLTGCRAIIVYNKSPTVIGFAASLVEEMTEMTERLRAVRSKDFCSFRSFRGTKILFRGKADDCGTIKYYPHGVIIVPQKEQKEFRGGR